MQTTYTLNTDELDERFLASIKAAFPHRAVAISIADSAEAEDATDYLLKSPANREHLLKSIAEADAGGELVKVSLAELERRK